MAAQSNAIMEEQASEPEWNEDKLVSSLARLKEMHIQVTNHSHLLQQYGISHNTSALIAPPSPRYYPSDDGRIMRAASHSRTVLLKFCKSGYESPRRHGRLPKPHEGFPKPSDPGSSTEEQRGELGWNNSLEGHGPSELAGCAERGLPEAFPH